MSTVTLRPPVATHRRLRFGGLFRAWRRHRQARGVFVAVMHPADLPPT